MKYIFSTLNLYFCRVFFVWLGTCLGIIGTVVALFEGTELVRRSLGKPHIDLSIILEMIMLKLPNQFMVLMPFIILSAAMGTFYRLNHTHEIIAARSAGLSIWQLIRGFIAFVLVVGSMQLIILNPLSAAMSKRFIYLESTYFSGNANHIAISEEGLWLREISKDRQSIIHTTHVQPDKMTFAAITFHNFLPDGPYTTRIDAKSAVLHKGYWELNDATIWDDKQGEYTSHPTLKIPTQFTIEKIQANNTSPETISFWSLSKFIDILNKSGLSSINYRLYWHGQIAKIGMMIAMILLAATFGFRPIRHGKTAQYIAYGIGGGFALYFLNDVVYALGLGNQVPILLAAWTPTLIVTFVSLGFLLHLEDG